MKISYYRFKVLLDLLKTNSFAKRKAMKTPNLALECPWINGLQQRRDRFPKGLGPRLAVDFFAHYAFPVQNRRCRHGKNPIALGGDGELGKQSHIFFFQKMEKYWHRDSFQLQRLAVAVPAS